MPFAKQKTLLSIPKITWKQVISSYLFAFFLGQLIFITIYSVWQVMYYLGKKPFDIVLFPGLASIGLYNISIGPYYFVLLRAAGITIFEFLFILFSYFFAKRFGAWIIKWAIFVLVILNLSMVIYW